MAVLWSTKFHESLCGKYTEYLKKKHEQTTFSLMATQVVFLQKKQLSFEMEEII